MKFSATLSDTSEIFPILGHGLRLLGQAPVPEFEIHFAG
jgi:hypothetical protein